MLQRRMFSLIAVMAIVCSLLVALPALAESNVRIVRLSFVDGDAQVNQSNDDAGFTHAVLNMPVTAGMWIYTPNGGRAEIQFENGSTVRLADDAQIQFEKLALSDSGGKINIINVDHGVVYFNFDKVKTDDNITIKAGGRTLQVNKSSHLRISANEKNVNVAVFRGNVILTGDTPVDVKSNETLALDPAAPDKYNLAKNVDKVGADSWDKDRDSEIAVLANRPTPASYPSSYNAQFGYLGAYGNFYNVAGYGSVWQPYGMGFGWDPFMNGVWGYYPGAGYTWVSSYPWGWGPYRYGSWNYLPAYGWVWAPGSSFTAWNVGPRYGLTPAGWHAPVQPVVPVGGKPTHVVVVGHPPNVHPAILAGHAEIGAHPDTHRVLATSHAAGSTSLAPHPTGANSGASQSGQHSGTPTHSGGATSHAAPPVSHPAPVSPAHTSGRPK